MAKAKHTTEQAVTEQAATEQAATEQAATEQAATEQAPLSAKAKIEAGAMPVARKYARVRGYTPMGIPAAWRLTTARLVLGAQCEYHASRATCMGYVAVAAKHLAAQGDGFTGADLIGALQALPLQWSALQSRTAYLASGAPCGAWLAGYASGAVRYDIIKLA